MFFWLLKYAMICADSTDAAWGQLAPRALVAGGASLLVVLLLGRPLIWWLRRIAPERIATASPTLNRLHQHKQATPTMGGLLIIAAVIGSVLLFGDTSNPYVLTAVVLTLALGAWALATIWQSFVAGAD